MQFFFLVATAYVLVVAVSCQPLLDAANDIDDRSGARWTRQPAIAKRVSLHRQPCYSPHH
jgi:hypothetical protein